MSEDRLSMSLDDIIKTNKSQSNTRGRGRYRRGGRGRGRGSHRFSERRSSANWKHDKYDDEAQKDPYKIKITNLHHEVMESDLEEHFSKSGDIRKIQILYDLAGRSEGTAFILYYRKESALDAIERFDEVSLDGMEMSVSLADNRPRAKRIYTKHYSNERGRSGRSIGKTRGRGRGGRVHAERPTVSKLDADLDTYMDTAE